MADRRSSADASVAQALVDYDNVRENRRERTVADFEDNLDALITKLATYARHRISVREINVRLYGGWIDAGDRLTEKGDQILKALNAARGRRNGISFRSEMAFSPASLTDIRLRGTYRHRNRVPLQKMVDSMVCLDAVYFARQCPTIVASDDDDIFVGALAAVAQQAFPVYLLRSRANGEALNDLFAQKYCLVVDQVFEARS